PAGRAARADAEGREGRVAGRAAVARHPRDPLCAADCCLTALVASAIVPHRLAAAARGGGWVREGCHAGEDQARRDLQRQLCAAWTVLSGAVRADDVGER